MQYKAWLPSLLGFITAVGPVSTDMYLPAFPLIEANLNVPEGSAQLTLAAWFLGLAFGQITQGTLSDRFGRRIPLLCGLALFTIGSAGCALAGSLDTLSAWRLAAAFGGSAGMVTPRAMVRDLSEGHGAAKLMSQLMLIMGVAPILAPSLGSWLLQFGGWRLLFWICTAYGAVSFTLAAMLLPDTLPPGERNRLSLMTVLPRYFAILREPVFASHAAMNACGMFGLFAYISGSPPVLLQGYGFTPLQYGMTFGLCACGIIGGSQINPPLYKRLGASRLLRYSSLTLLFATVLLVASSVAGRHSAATIIAPLLLCTMSLGILLPNTTIGALTNHAPAAATATALMGTLSFALGAVSGTLAGLFTDGTARGMAGLMLCGAIGVVIADRYRPVDAVAATG
jgi:DHA1 family bicyclomycin/chloramphenicol resistance-like MFS transporter